MRTTKLFTGVITALGLMYSSGCCDTDCAPPRRIAEDCAPVAYPVAPTMSTVTYEPDCPPTLVVTAPAVRTTRARPPRATNCYSRKRVRYYYASPCDPCGPQYYPAVAYAGTTSVIANPGYITTSSAVSVAPVVVKEPPRETVTVLQRGRKGRKVAYRNGESNTRRAAAYTAGAATRQSKKESDDSYSFTSLSPSAATFEPDDGDAAEAVDWEVESMAEAAPEKIDEPEYAKYLDPEAPATVIADASANAATGPMELVPGQVLEAPMPVGQSSMQPIVIQPIIQPVIAPSHQPMTVMPGSGQVQGVLAAPPTGAWVEGGMVSSAYCPPEICPVPVGELCAPGRNMSDCFTLSENQLLNSPRIYAPEAANPLLPLSQAPGGVSPAPYQPAPPAGIQGKYAALTPPPEMARPQVSMPTPLGGDNIPVVPGTAEIESMLDAMVPPPNQR